MDKRPTHVSLDSSGDFHFNIINIKHGTRAYQSLWERAMQASAYQSLWERAMQASAKVGKAQVALRGYQRIQQSNLKEAMRIYLDDLVQKAAVVCLDWWIN